MDEQKDTSASRAIEFKTWVLSACFALFVFDIFFLYVFITSGPFTLLSISNVIAATAAIMIGSSFALSGLCYYFTFFDTYIFYRKYLGLIGFWLALLYSIMLLFVNPERYFYGFFENIDSLNFILGLSAMAIFTMMALISNKWAMLMLGPQNWRRMLRLGYLAYGMLVIRAFDLENDMWTQWLQMPDSLPPVRLVISIFAVSVILLRISLIFSKYFKSKKADTKRSQITTENNSTSYPRPLPEGDSSQVVV